MTTGPDGDYVRPADRLVDIRERYGSDDEVTRFGELAASQILATALRKLGQWLDSDSQA